jgi:aryl-alcohol dehydrogenase-like predicted oxidoreductase
MQTRQLGSTGISLTTIGIGTWAIGGPEWAYGWGRQDDTDSIAAIRRGLELGINWIDTAPAYGLGHSEEVVARAVEVLSPKPFIATKCGMAPLGNGKLGFSLKAADVRAQVEESLKRLRVERIDLMQVHWPNPDRDIEGAWAELSRCVKAGKIRCIGVSNFSIAQLKRIMPIHAPASLQPPYSMLERDVERELLAFCASNGMGVIVYSPMQKGILTGKFNRTFAEGLTTDDHRRYDPHFREPLLSANLALLNGLREIAVHRGITVAQLAVRWVLRRPEVTAAIVGARRPLQIEETAMAGDAKLWEEDIAAVGRLLARREQTRGPV